MASCIYKLIWTFCSYANVSHKEPWKYFRTRFLKSTL